jgi:ATP-dependent HslUV protease ATP-binding subunit HslU
MSNLTPREIVAELDKHIIGQADAKRAVAVALRNRWRRQQLEPAVRDEITPKNILMIGPTGVGKTEIARRIARITSAPFVKVEATKFTEVGYVGRNVESIIRDLADTSFKMLRDQRIKEAKPRTKKAAERQIINILMAQDQGRGMSEEEQKEKRKELERKLRDGELDDQEILVPMHASANLNVDIVGMNDMEDIAQQLQSVVSKLGQAQKGVKRRIKIKSALQQLQQEEAFKETNQETIKADAIKNAEHNGIVFIDEIDKIASRGAHGTDVSREGVQRDLLPLIEGCAVKTRYGMLRTDHVLFITSGAFLLSKPSDMVPELQGRLPIRVKLGNLDAEDFYRILTEPDMSLIEQYRALMSSEGLTLEFDEDALRRIAQIAWQLNDTTENIGARRLHTVMERLLEEVSYNATDMATQKSKTRINLKYVETTLADIIKEEDLSRFIL